jgi:hypothetical protein
MSTTTDEVQIDLDLAEDAKAKKNGADEPEIQLAEAGAPASIVKPEEGLEKLKKQLDDEKTARLAAEQRANEAAESERQAKTENQGTQLDLVKNAIITVTQANDALEVKYAEALAAQDFTAVAKINRQMGENSAKLLRLEDGKTAIEKAPKPTVRPTTDPVEQFVSTMTPQSASWVRAHAEYATNPKKTRAMIRAHEDAIDEGLRADTPAYFESIERTLGLQERSEPIIPEIDPMADAAKPIRKAAPASAPVTRSGNGAGARPNVVTLSAEEREVAKLNGMTDQEYAREKVALKREGKLN